MIYKSQRTKSKIRYNNSVFRVSIMIRHRKRKTKTKKQERDADSDFAVNVKAVSSGTLESTVQTAITVCALLVGISVTLLTGNSFGQVSDKNSNSIGHPGLDLYQKGD